MVELLPNAVRQAPDMFVVRSSNGAAMNIYVGLHDRSGAMLPTCGMPCWFNRLDWGWSAANANVPATCLQCLAIERRR